MEYNFSFLENKGDKKQPSASSRADFLAGLRSGQDVQEREEKRLAALRKAQEAKKRTKTTTTDNVSP